VGRLPLGDAALRWVRPKRFSGLARSASMLSNRRGADFLCYIAVKDRSKAGQDSDLKVRRTHLAGRREGNAGQGAVYAF
jgi:hypothetical protein